MSSENKQSFDKGSHLERSKSLREATNFRGVPSDLVDLLSCNIPLGRTMRRGMNRVPRDGKRNRSSK